MNPVHAKLWSWALAVSAARQAGSDTSAILGQMQRSDVHPDALNLFDLIKPLLDQRADSPPWVIGQLGQSLDGFVATRSGDSCFINGPDNLLHLHRLRALCDAVIVGPGTVAADNPRLTTRLVAGPHPTRVVLDATLRLANLVQTLRLFADDQAPSLWLCDGRFELTAANLLGHERVLAVPGLIADDGTLKLQAAVNALHMRGHKLLFVEGGGVTVSRFLEQGCLQRLHLAIAPLLIGDGKPGLRFTGVDRLADCRRPACRTYPMGSDQLWDLDLA